MFLDQPFDDRISFKILNPYYARELDVDVLYWYKDTVPYFSYFTKSPFSLILQI